MKKETPKNPPSWIQNRDCREGMKTLGDRSISLLLTDPPYFIKSMDAEWDETQLRKKLEKSGVVGGLPVGMKFDPRQGKRLREFLLPIAKEWLRVLKPGSFTLCFSQARLVHHTAMAIEESGFEIRDILAWKYEGQAKAFTQNHFIRRKKNLTENHKQYITNYLGNRKTPQLKPQMEMLVLGQAPREGTFVDNWMKWRTGLIDVSNPLLNCGKFPGTVMSVSKPRERHGHLTAKPVDLLRHLIRIFCDDYPNTVVLDPFAGCGSTGVAAVMEGRTFIGFETNGVFTQRGNERIQSILRQIRTGVDSVVSPLY